MKKIFGCLGLLLTTGAFAQTVNNFYPLDFEIKTYSVVVSSPSIDETTTGENITWNFNDLTLTGYSATTAEVTTDEQQTTYPGSVVAVETSSQDQSYQSTFYFNHGNDGSVAVTGADSNGITLNYVTDNFSLGNFPKSYGDAVFIDDIAGNFEGNGFAGTFTGTGSVSVDGYGALSTNIGPNGTPYTYQSPDFQVTRLKIEQQLTLYVSGIPVGTFSQVMYSYYSALFEDTPVFRTLTTTVNALGVNQTQQSIESYSDPNMGVNSLTLLNMAIAPNPVNNILHLSGDAEITALTITDAMGRMVLQSNTNDVDVSCLSTGVYNVGAATQSGSKSLKMVKQ